jgi:hypothetical protein
MLLRLIKKAEANAEPNTILKLLKTAGLWKAALCFFPQTCEHSGEFSLSTVHLSEQ